MKTRTLLAGVSALAIASAAYFYLGRDENLPPVMTKEGETTKREIVVTKKTVDYETVLEMAIAEKSALVTLTVSADRLRNRKMETSINYTPLPSSTALVRVGYNVEYTIGYVFKPGRFSVRGGVQGLVVTLARPSFVARPSVKLKSYKIIESGFLIDEKTALLELQQHILPVEERRASQMLARPDVLPRSEQVLRGFLQSVVRREGEAVPPITFNYR